MGTTKLNILAPGLSAYVAAADCLSQAAAYVAAADCLGVAGDGNQEPSSGVCVIGCTREMQQ